MRIGMLTAGGDCPGLNAVIRAAGKQLRSSGHEAIGIRRGFRGLAERDLVTLGDDELSGILHLGGTILSTSSFDPFNEERGTERVRECMQADSLDCVIAIGGEHTMWITKRAHEELGLPMIGVPKTIDNDVVGTDFTFGFDTAVQVAVDAIDRLHTTAQSHDRVMIVEVMGRNVGWIAVFAGIAGGADAILVPEQPLEVEQVAAAIGKRHDRGKDFSIIVVAEGAELAFENGERRVVRSSEERDEYGYPRLGGIGQALAVELEQRTGFDTRVTVLGHLQRGGTPTATDRLLATRYGTKAAEMAISHEFGRMAALHGTEMTSVSLADVDGVKRVPPEYVALANRFAV